MRATDRGRCCPKFCGRRPTLGQCGRCRPKLVGSAKIGGARPKSGCVRKGQRTIWLQRAHWSDGVAARGAFGGGSEFAFIRSSFSRFSRFRVCVCVCVMLSFLCVRFLARFVFAPSLRSLPSTGLGSESKGRHRAPASVEGALWSTSGPRDLRRIRVPQHRKRCGALRSVASRVSCATTSARR